MIAGRDAMGAWAELQAGRWGLWLPLCMTAGAVAELASDAEPPAWLGPVLLAATLVPAVLLRRRPWGRMPALAGVAAALGLLSAQCATWRAPPLLEVPRRAVFVTGTVRSVELLPRGARVTLSEVTLRAPEGVEATPAAGRSVRIRLRDPPDTPPPEAGERLLVRAMLSAPSPPAYPGGWDLRRDAFFGGIGAYGFALNPARRLGMADGAAPDRVLQATREVIARRIDAVLPPEQAAIAATLLTGSASAMAAADKAAFRDSGLAHLLAIAGLHIGIVMGLVFGAVRLALAAVPFLALRLPTKALAALASVGAGGLYMLLTGAHVPIIRSFAMACLVLLAVLTGRRALSLRALGLAMAAIVALAPDEVLGVSFQMSFSAVLALIAGYDALRPWLRRLRGDGGVARRAAGFVAGLAITSALAGTASTPYGAYHFGHIQLYYVLANMAAVPLTALWVMPLGLLALLLMPLGWEAAALIPMGWGEAAILWIGRAVAALPDAVVAVPAPSPGGLIALSLGLAWLGIWRGPVRCAGLLGIAAGVLSAGLARPPDVMVSADARLIGVRLADGAYAQVHSGASSFTSDAWLARWVAPSLIRLPASGDLAGGAIACDPTACVVRLPGGAVRIARAPPGPEACAAAVIVAAEPVRLRCGAEQAVVIDRFTVWRAGAVAAWLDGSGRVRVLTSRAVTGDRPWAPPPRRAQADPGLPLAATE